MIKVLRERLINQEIGLGIAALGRPGYMTLTHNKDLPDKSKKAMEQHAHHIFDIAWENGIRYFDTARSYGDGEKFLASWLHAKKIPKNEVVVGSKWGYVYTADWKVEAENHEIKYHTIENLNKQWQQTQSILGDYLNIYHIHSATLESGVLDNKAILDRLYEIKKGGTVVGLSLTGSNQSAILKKALTIRYDGELLFGSVQATWNILEPSVQKQLGIAKDAGFFVILKEVMANGRIPTLSEDHLSVAQIETLKSLSDQYDIMPDQIAIKAALQLKLADVILSGAVAEKHLLSNLNVASQKVDQVSLNKLIEKPEDFWRERSQLEWI